MRSRQQPPVDEPEFEEAELELADTPSADREDETEELHSAAQLLEITNESNLDRFIGGLLQKAARVAGSALPASVLQPLTGTLRVALKNALPIVGGSSRAILSTSHHDTGAKLAAAAGSLFGLELEGLSPEDQEFEVARRFVRLTRAMGRRGSRLARRLPPRAAVRRTLVTTARRHAPGLLRRGARLMVPITYVVQPPPIVEEPAPIDDAAAVQDPDTATDLTEPSPDPSRAPAQDQDPDQNPEPEAFEFADKPTCHCGGHCAHCRSHRSGRWVRQGGLIILQDI